MTSLKDRSLLVAMVSIYGAFFGIENSQSFVRELEGNDRGPNGETVTGQRTAIFSSNGECLGPLLRPGNAPRADDWDDRLVAERVPAHVFGQHGECTQAAGVTANA